MSADSEKPNIIGVIGRNIALWQNLWVVVGQFERRSSSARARRLRSAAGSINSGRHILESRCAERCAKDAFLTSFRATLNGKKSNISFRSKGFCQKNDEASLENICFCLPVPV